MKNIKPIIYIIYNSKIKILTGNKSNMLMIVDLFNDIYDFIFIPDTSNNITKFKNETILIGTNPESFNHYPNLDKKQYYFH